MGIWARSFVLDGVPCGKYGLEICDFDEKNGKEFFTSSPSIDLKTSKSPSSNTWKLHNSNYSEPLPFEISVCKIDKSPIHILEQSAINRWIIGTDNTYKWLQFVQEGYEGIFYKVKCIKSDNISISKTNYGMKFEFICNSPYGYTKEYTKSYTGSLTGFEYEFRNDSDELGELYPKIKIVVNSDSDIMICNNLTMDKDDANTWFKIKNCCAGEVINVDCEKEIITTTLSSHKIYNDFNFTWFAFSNNLSTRKNNITIFGDAEVTFTYRFIRKVGV